MTEAFTFEPATKDQAKARIALAGPSGSGKTWTSLTIGTALGRKVAVIDTERGSASKYAGDFAFDRLNMQRYDPRDLPRALAAAAQAGYDVVIIDSLSKFWAGPAGMLEQVDNAAKRGYGGNSFGGWKEARPMESAMLEALLGYPGHVIVTMRTKTAYEIVEDERGRKVPSKIGLKPEQREGIEYEFDIVGDMDLQNAMTVSKSRCRALTGQVIQRPDASLGEEILAWLSDGKPSMSALDYRDRAVEAGTGPDALRALHTEVKRKGLLGAAVIDDAGETVTLGALIVRKGQEAAQAGRGIGVAISHGPPDEDRAQALADASGTQEPEDAVAGGDSHTDPADDGPSRFTEDEEWAFEATARASAFTTPKDGEGLWAEVVARHQDGLVTDDERASISALMKARLQDLRSPQEPVEGTVATGLDPEDPWAAKVESVTSQDDAEAAKADVRQQEKAGHLTGERAEAITTAINLRVLAILKAAA